MNRNTKARKRLTLLERKALDAHWEVLGDFPCIVTGNRGVTLHHCHGGSMKDAGIHRGMGQRPSDWLVIPIIDDLHTGARGIDSGMGVLTWEERFGTQMHHLRKISRLPGYNVFELAGYDIEI